MSRTTIVAWRPLGAFLALAACTPARASGTHVPEPTASSAAALESQEPERQEDMVATYHCVCSDADDGTVVCGTSIVMVPSYLASPYRLDRTPSLDRFPAAFTVVIDGHRTSYR